MFATNIDHINSLVQDEKDQSYKDGVHEGYRVASIILKRWASNSFASQREPLELSEKELEELRLKM
jgi:hypothetical protein